MGLPISYVTSVEVEAGIKSCFAVRAPIRGVINRFIIKQIDGTAEGFTFSIFDREDACSSISEDSDNPDDLISLHHPDVHVVHNGVAAAGATVVTDLGLDRAYENMDERSPVTIRQTGALYIELESVSAATFHIGYTILTESGM